MLFSPLTLGTALGPHAAEHLLSVAVVAVMALDLAGLLKAPALVRCALCLTLALLDARLMPAALLYALLAGGAYRWILAGILAAGAGIGIRALLAPATMPAFDAGIDSSAGPFTIIAIGCALFAIAPLALFAIRRVPALAALAGGAFLRALALGTSAFVMGAFATTGDPSPYWLCGEVAFVAGIASMLARAERVSLVVGALVCIFVAQSAAFAAARDHLPAVSIARNSATLRSVLAADAATGTPFCVVADAAAKRHILENEAIRVGSFSEASQCLFAAAPGTDLIVLSNWNVTDWGAGGIELARAERTAESAAYVLPVEHGIVAPHTPAATVTGTGAFGNTTDTPIGAVGNFTILSGYSYEFRCVPRAARLTFAIAGLPNAAFAYSVVALDDRGAHTVLSESVPSTTSATLAWRFHSVALPAPSGCESLRFAVTKPPGAPEPWVSIAGAALQ